jgi:hypothetical protein
MAGLWGLASLTDVTDFVGVVVWPLLIAFAILVAVSNRGRALLRPLLRRIRKISGGKVSIELSEETAAATKTEVQGAIGEYSKALDDEFERLAYAEEVRRKVALVMKDIGADGVGGEVRATVHIRDALFKDGLYQLVDYWPKGKGAGRRYSTRFGMLGRAWRMEETLYEPDIPVSPQELIEQWGMTQEQAASSGEDRRSFLCCVLEHDKTLVGVLYVDSKRAKAFEAMKDRFENSLDAHRLAEAVYGVHKKIAARGPGIKVLDSD